MNPESHDRANRSSFGERFRRWWIVVRKDEAPTAVLGVGDHDLKQATGYAVEYRAIQMHAGLVQFALDLTIVLDAPMTADRLPNSLMLCVAEAVAQHGNLEPAAACRAILHCVPTPDFRDATAEFIDLWHTRAGAVGAEAVAVSLVTAAKCEHDHRREETVEIVWTGPEPAETRFRQTEQAILEVVNSATRRLTVVSYAVYRIPRIREALVAAANRGVGIQLIEGQGEYDCLLAIGGNVASACSVYYWPQEKRSKDDNGKIGILHVKCALGDGHRMFLSSANFTEYAFTINMELGVLVTGGPDQVQRHFERLMDEKHLLRL